jgi:C-terminal processing protease CtpA/Prc
MNYQIIRHLLTRRDTSDQWLQIPKTIYPDQKNMVGYQKLGWHLTPDTPHVRGNVVFITDARAISNAESVISFIKHYDFGEIIGQPTAGTNGGVNMTALPGGYKFGWTGTKVVKHNGSRHFMTGIQPTIPVERTIQGVREGKDEFLEKAIEVLR